MQGKGFSNEAETKQPWLPSWMLFIPGRKEHGFVHLLKVSKHPVGQLPSQGHLWGNPLYASFDSTGPLLFLHLVMHIGPVDMVKKLVRLCVSHMNGCV